MEKLNALPILQKMLIIAVLLALVFGAFYYLVITDQQAALTQANGQHKQAQTEYTQLKEFEEKQRQYAVQKQKEAEERKLEENKRMLPTEDEVEAFIEGIQADAKAAGLKVQKFDPLDHEIEDYYKKIPYKVELLGDTLELIDFLQTLAAPKKRIINVREIDISRLPIDLVAIERATGGNASDFDRIAKFKRMRKEEKELSNEERRMLKLQRWQLANEMNQVRVTFVAYTFSYTGKEMPEELRSKRRKKTRRRS